MDVLDKAVERCHRTMAKRDAERTSAQNLAQLLQLASEMKPVATIKKAVRTARRRQFFVDMCVVVCVCVCVCVRACVCACDNEHV